MALIRQGRLDEARPLIEQARAVLARGNWFESVAWLAAAVVMFDAAEGRYGDAEALVNEVVDRDRAQPRWELVPRRRGDRRTGRPRPGPGRHDDTNEQVIATATRWIGWMEAVEHDGRRPTVEQQLHRDHAMAELQRLRGQSDPQRVGAAGGRLGTNRVPLRRGLRTVPPRRSAPGRHDRSIAAARRAATDALGAAYAVGSRTRRDTTADRHRRPRPSSPPARRHEQDRPTRRRDEDRAMALGLTPREHEVLALLARGRSNGEIAKELFITTKTASVHVSNILRKLDVTNRVEAANLARRP